MIKALTQGIQYKNGARNLGQHTYTRKFDSDFSREMSRSVREALKVWQKGGPP
jgi:hypothetical protein